MEKNRACLYFSLLVFLSAITVLHSGTALADECKLKVGIVPQFEQRKLFEIWNPILETLEEKVGCSFELQGTSSIPSFEKEFKAGTYDLSYMNPFHLIIAHKAQGYLPLIRSGKKKLRGILVVPATSPIENVKDLNGKVIAFPSPNALGASLLMRYELSKKHGVNFKPRYVRTHSSVYLHVAKELTAAGGGVNRTLQKQPKRIHSRLRVIHTTASVPAHPLVIHPRVPETTKQKIKEAMLNLGNSPMIAKIPMYGPVATSIKDYDLLKTMGLEEFAE